MQKVYSKSKLERIVKSEFVHPVPGDGLCILNSFLVNLRTVDKNVSVETLKSMWWEILLLKSRFSFQTLCGIQF